MLRKFFYVSASLLMLALAYHLGASTATAQAPSNPVVGLTDNGSNAYVAITANGDIYYSGAGVTGTWSRGPNVFGGGPVPTTQSSWGALKVQSR